MSDDFVDDDFGHRVLNITLEQERVADLMKGCAHGLDVLRLNAVVGVRTARIAKTPLFAGPGCSLARDTIRGPNVGTGHRSALSTAS
jgi:hypothetical protein